MRLNAANLQATLSAILGVDPAYVVPRQGNWFQPTGGENYPGKPKTWCAFRIDGTRPVTTPHFVALDTETNWSVAHKIASISLQFVGDVAEDLANSVVHWLHNSAVQDAWAAYDGRLMASSGAVTVTDFDQQGANTVLAYNVRIEVVYADEIDSGQTYPIPDFEFEGQVVGVK